MEPTYQSKSLGMDEKFSRQVAKAKKQNYGLAGAVRRGDFDLIRDRTRTQDFNDLADRAYNSREGYAIQNVDGQKVMYVSGSRNIYDWFFNVAGGVLPSKTHVFSNRTVSNLNKIARDQDVDVVVGHSRGAKLVSQMRGSFQRFGLDGAMMLARDKDRDMINIAQKQPLDMFIARGGRRNKFYRVKRVGKSHFISRDYKGYRQRFKRRDRYIDNFVSPFFNPYS